MCARTQRALSSSSSALRRFLRGVRALARARMTCLLTGAAGGVSLSPVVAATASLCFFGFLFLVAPLIRALLSLLLGRGARACRPPLALLGLLGRNAPRVLGVALGDLARA